MLDFIEKSNYLLYYLLIYLLTHSMQQSPSCEANSFSASQGIPLHFSDPESSLPHSQVLVNCPYPEPDQSSQYSHITILEDQSSYYSPVYASVSQVVSSLMFPHQNLLYASPILHTCYKPRPLQSSRFGHPKNNRWGVQITKIFIM